MRDGGCWSKAKQHTRQGRTIGDREEVAKIELDSEAVVGKRELRIRGGRVVALALEQTLTLAAESFPRERERI
jgi:hypothetical protein